MILKQILSAGLLLSNVVTPISVETTDVEPMFMTLDLSKGDPLDTLKEELIKAKAEEGLFDINDIDIEQSLLLVDSFQPDDPLHQTNAHVLLTYLDTAPETLAYSFSTPVYISIEQTDEPILILTQDAVELYVGDEFNPEDYIFYAAIGDDYHAQWLVQNTVDTETVGTYEVTYTLMSIDGEKTDATLTVEVYDPRTTFTYYGVTIKKDGTVQAMFEAINAARIANGLHPYEWAEEAAAAAQQRAVEAASYLSHDRPDGTRYYTILDEYGITPCHYPLEILVAYGNSVATNLNWWLGHPPHAVIVLASDKDRIAIGHYGSVWAAEVY